jgi:hypothetical protein
MVLADLLSPFEWMTTDGRPIADADGTHPNDDDFLCDWHGMMGRVECMNSDNWYYGVYTPEDQLHHWGDDYITPHSREAALFLCESLMKIRLLHKVTGAENVGLSRLRTTPSPKDNLAGVLRLMGDARGVAEILRLDPAFGRVRVEDRTGGMIRLRGTVATAVDKKRLHELALEAFGEIYGRSIANGVKVVEGT